MVVCCLLLSVVCSFCFYYRVLFVVGGLLLVAKCYSFFDFVSYVLFAVCCVLLLVVPCVLFIVG